MRVPAGWLRLLALALVVPAALAAQTPRRGLVEVPAGERHGFWLGLGLGAGGEQFDLADGLGYSDALWKPALTLKAGGTLGQHFRLGGEIAGWINDQGDATESLTSFLAMAQFYPIASTGLYLKGGVGLGRSAVDFSDGYTVADVGFAANLGAGWEARVGRHFYLVPAVDWIGHSYDQRGGPAIHERVLNVTLGVVWQP